ncbi:MAG: hypothetical protein GY906_38670 [bacterium]|nr:hypothetical protein [bacterium]
MGVVEDLKNRIARFRLKGQELENDVSAIQAAYVTADSLGNDAEAAILYETLAQGRVLTEEWARAWADVESFLSVPSRSVVSAVVVGAPLAAKITVIEGKINLYHTAATQMVPTELPPMPAAGTVTAGIGTALVVGLGAMMFLAGRKGRR